METVKLHALTVYTPSTSEVEWTVEAEVGWSYDRETGNTSSLVEFGDVTRDGLTLAFDEWVATYGVTDAQVEKLWEQAVDLAGEQAFDRQCARGDYERDARRDTSWEVNGRPR